MIHDKYTISGLGEICNHLQKYKDLTEPWKADFYNVFGGHIFQLEGDEETMERLQDDDDTYTMVTEIMDVALSMGRQY